MRRRALLLIAGLLAVFSRGGVTAQTPDARAGGAASAALQAAEAPRPPALLVHEGDEPSTPLALESARYEVTILGLVARTRATLVFRNDAERVYEGELVYPLPEGSIIAGFALDVQGQLVDAVIVEAREARVAFEAEVRKGIDPGLVEWVRGNTFRTRVWPVPARGRRTIRVEYLSELPVRVEQAAAEALYELPLRFGGPIAELSLRVEIAGDDVAPLVRSGPSTFAFARWQERLVAEATERDVVPQDLIIALPHKARETVTVETEASGETYFVIDDFPVVPPAEVQSGASVGRLAVLWDASLSRDGADRERDLRLLAAHLARLGDVEVVATIFRDVAEPPRRFVVKGGDARALIDVLRAAPCDGATALSTLPVPDDVAYALVFTDGVWTLGSSPTLAGTRPLFVLDGSGDADRGLLSAWAAATGGAAIDLRRHTEAEVLDRIGRPVFSLLSVSADGGVADLEPQTAQPVDGRVTVAGRLTGSGARVHLRYGFPGGGALVKTHEVRATPASSTGLAARRWAGRRVAALSLAPEAHGAALVDLGRQFSIVTPGTSLLVLETIDQHVEHRVRPPESLPELRREYDERLAEDVSERSKARGEKLAAVLQMWTRHVAWWQHRFKYPPRFRYQATKTVLAARPGVVAGRPADRVPAAPPPAAPPPAAPPPPAPSPAAPPQMGEPVRSASENLEVRAPMPMVQMSSAVSETVSVRTAAPNNGPTIVVAPWTPETPYLKALAAARGAGAYAAYLDERRRYGTAPGFFLDCADLFARRGERALALRILTNLAELRVEDARLLRVLAHRLEQLGELDRSIEVFERVRRLRPEEPQSHRDLALALDRRASRGLAAAGAVPASAVADARRALSLLAEVVMGEWDERFAGIERLALEEGNRVATLLDRRHVPVDWPLDPRLRQLIDLDLRIVLTWDTDLTDMDLWVTEPSGERCDYSHNVTTIGGAMSDDFTAGYGPEVYTIRRGMRGTYRVQASFYGSDAQTLTGPTTVQAIVVTNYGRPGERRRAMTLRLSEAEDEVDIGAVVFAPGNATRR